MSQSVHKCSTPPMEKLLGLGSKLFIQSTNFNHKYFKSMIERFKYDVRVKHYVKHVQGKLH